MTIVSLMGQTALIYKPVTVTDRYQDRAKREYPQTPTATHPCRLQLRGGSEDRDGRNLASGVWVLELPAEADVDEHDQVVVDGKRFDVISVYPVNEPGRGVHHQQVELRTYNATVPSG